MILRNVFRPLSMCCQKVIASTGSITISDKNEHDILFFFTRSLRVIWFPSLRIVFTSNLHDNGRRQKQTFRTRSLNSNGITFSAVVAISHFKFCSTHEKCTKYIVLWFNVYIVVYFPECPLHLERVRVRGHNSGVANVFWFFLSKEKRSCHRLGYARTNSDTNAQFSSHPWDPCTSRIEWKNWLLRD